MKFRKKPVVIEASLWNRNGDHPQDMVSRGLKTSTGEVYDSEGLVVRYFRRPDVSGETPCRQCDNILHNHGWIDTLEGGHIVCPGDWIITGVQGERYPCKPDIFRKTYERVDDAEATQ